TTSDPPHRSELVLRTPTWREDAVRCVPTVHCATRPTSPSPCPCHGSSCVPTPPREREDQGSQRCARQPAVPDLPGSTAASPRQRSLFLFWTEPGPAPPGSVQKWSAGRPTTGPVGRHRWAN